MTTKTLDLAQAEKHFGAMQEHMKAAAKRGLVSAAALMVQEIVLRIVPQRSPQPVDRGVYRAGWRSGPADYGAFVENTETHAAFIEYGVKNVKIGPRTILMLSEWARRKFGLDPEQATQAAWRIARLIKSRGIFAGGVGLGILKQANERAPDFIRREVERELARL